MRSLGLALGFGVLGGLTGCTSATNETPASRGVTPAPAPCVADASGFRVGGFHLGPTPTDATQISADVTHEDDPSKILFAPKSGVPLVALAKASLTSVESHGSFSMTEVVGTRCEGLRGVQAACDGDRLVVRGTVGEAPTCGVGFEISFKEEATGRLGFSVDVADPAYNRIELRYASSPSEGFLGFGEQFTYGDLKGQRVEILTQEQGIGRGDPSITTAVEAYSPGSAGGPLTTYVAFPHYLTTEARSLFLRNSEYSVFDLTAPDEVRLTVFSSGAHGAILRGPSPLDLVERYTAAVGRMRALPDWVSKGAIVGMQGGTAAVRDVLAKLKARSTPIAAFWLQDWCGRRETSFGSQLWWNWEVDQDRYPEWPALVSDLRADAVRVLGYMNPFLVDVKDKPNARRNLFQEATEKGYVVKKADGSPVAITVTDFPAALVDFTNPEARTWIESVMVDLLQKDGISGWMADFGEALPFEAAMKSGESGAVAHNRYPVDWAQTNQEAFAKAGRTEDGIYFSRAGGSGSLAAASLFWLGDQTVTWDEFDGFRSAVRGLVGGGFSGMAFNHWDIGGYTTLSQLGVMRTKELLFRWTESSAFTAVYRTHEGNQPTKNAQFSSDEESLDQFARFAKVYAALGAYRATVFKEAADHGWPVVRHPWLHFSDDRELLKLAPHELEMMLGSEVLVAPVLEPGATTRRVYFPKGKWVHLLRGDVFGDESAGGYVAVDAPLGTPPAFVRQGSTAADGLRKALRDAGVIP